MKRVYETGFFIDVKNLLRAPLKFLFWNEIIKQKKNDSHRLYIMFI